MGPQIDEKIIKKNTWFFNDILMDFWSAGGDIENSAISKIWINQLSELFMYAYVAQVFATQLAL